MKTVVSFTAMILFASSATAVTAEPANDSSGTELVSYANLDLNSIRDRQRLESLVRAAASRVCTEDNGAAPTDYVNSRCYRSAMISARLQIDRAVAEAKGGAAVVLRDRRLRSSVEVSSVR